MNEELTQEQINSLLAGIDIDDDQIKRDTWKQKISDALAGRVFSDEHKKKLSVSGKGKIISDEQREILRKVNTDRILSPESKEKMSESAKERGDNRSDETKQTMYDARIAYSYSEEELIIRAESSSKYIYTTPKGEFKSARALLQAYPELNRSKLDHAARTGNLGFSRRLK